MIRLFHALLAGAVLLFTAAPALAQEEDGLTLAEARAIADQVIAKGNAAAYFENISEEGLPIVRHRRSGLICLLNDFPEGASITIIDSPLPKGDDVACSLLLNGTTATLYATRYNPPVSDEEVVYGAVEAIRQHWDNVVEFKGSIPAPKLENPPPMGGAAFYAEQNGQEVYTQVVVATMGDWGIKLRITGPKGELEAVQKLGAGLFGYAIDHIRKKPGKD